MVKIIHYILTVNNWNNKSEHNTPERYHHWLSNDYPEIVSNRFVKFESVLLYMSESDHARDRSR